MSIPGTIAAVLTLLSLIFFAVAWDRREVIREFFAECVYAWRDVTREMP